MPTLPFTFHFNRDLKQEEWTDMDQVLQLNQLLKYLFQWSMENKGFNLATHWEGLGASCQKICLKEIPYKDLMVINKGWNLTRKFRLLEERETRIRENQSTIQSLEEHLNQTGPTLVPSGSQGVDQHNSPVASNHSSTNRSVAKSQHSSQSQAKAERFRPNDPEAVGLGERSTQDPEIVVNTSRISIPNNRYITPTQNEHIVVTTESNLKRDSLWLQMSQSSEKTQKQFAELQEIHERMKILTSSMDKIVEALQEGHAQLSNASEETNKILNEVIEEMPNYKRDRDCLDQELKKLLNVYQNMKPQTQGHVLIIHTTKKTSNHMPFWRIRQGVHLNTNMEKTCLILRRNH
ncbi:hypothetical protein O181_055783 [Austropuccinia psidii MF-1]|uniref:Uncharacterized protein n=1 Tax=Austropuccinia psidii MF-1 TaxID=1389203 RepID=A0A9Q3HSU1_9BASI|nr:hypothetical protein [Austropuccinia psidii MF-1]